ncbi:phage tail tape measure protein [Acidovorax sp. SUPP3334]|uniref:phage tail tape measure protein n=1 Tax=Acidovorax sp. SUPP3334 TaxID=2920881 RepID=UPI0023DE552C|nr:phage tail tape measure protein [Acidovorax sp. SUPP3334]GKT21651.1 phage tail tape measure protein [Acidovorax sp. SUPP3334]
MANELIVGVKIGAALAGSFQAAFATAKGTLGQLGQAADLLKTRHDRMGNAMALALAHPMRNVGALRTQYERLGATIERVTARHAALAASLARGEALRQQRADLRGSVMETAGTAVAMGAPVVQSMRLAIGHEDRMRDIAITGDFSAKEEAQVGAAVRESALKWNQTQAEVAQGVSVLVAGGIQSAKELANYAPLMAKMATATRSSMDNLGSVAIALKDNLGITAAGFDGAMNMLAYAGKRGQFEIRDMAKWVPSIAPAFQALGVTGKEAVAEIGAALQIARKGAGSNDEAANNFRNFLQKITAPDTIKDFAKAGIDLKASMMNLRAQGLTPVQAMLGTITAYMQAKGPAAAGELQKALALKDDKEREAALQRLAEAYKLGDLFQDMQAMAFIRPALANMDEMRSIKQGAVGAADKGVIDDDFKKRMDTASAQLDKFKIGMMDLGMTIGDALLPPLVEVLQATKPVISAFADWAKAHPGLVKGLIGLTGGLLVGKMALLGLAYGFNLLLSPFAWIRSGMLAIGARWTMLQALWQAGRFAPVVAGLKAVGGGIATVARFAAMFGRGLVMTFIGPLKLAGQALLWLGRAMLMNPIGLAITAVGVAAYLVWKHWDTIKGAFIAAWGWLRGVKDQFFAAGGELINGLVAGVGSKLSAARETIVALGGDIKGWFKSALGINSPSRVFMDYGDNIVQGAAIGIQRTSPMAAKAVTGMAMAAVAAGAHAEPVALPWPNTSGIAQPSPAFGAVQAAARPLAQPFAGREPADDPLRAQPAGPAQAMAQQVLAARSAAAGGSQPTTGRANAPGSGVVIHFSPTIQVPGGPGAKAAVTEALQLSLPELERLIARVQAQQQRRSN